ncbi:unnamed protein product [Lampetra planeri]
MQVADNTRTNLPRRVLHRNLYVRRAADWGLLIFVASASCLRASGNVRGECSPGPDGGEPMTPRLLVG